MPPKKSSPHKDELQLLCQKRERLITKLNDYYEFYEQCRVSKEAISNVSIINLKRRCDACEGLLIQFEALQDQIIAIEIDNDQDHSIEAKNFENKCYELMSEIENFITQSQKVVKIEKNVINNQNIKLPTIQLPFFNGSYEQWLSFHDTFDSLIHNNDSLSNIQKLHYLRSCLKGEAACIIQALTNTSENYDVAWKLVKKRYDNKKLIIDNYVKTLFNLPSVIQNSSTSLRTHVDQFIKNVKALEAIDQPSVDTLLIYLATSKLDSSTREKWEEHTLKTELPTRDDLIEFLQERCQILESRSINKSISVKSLPFQTQTKRNHTVSAHTITQKYCHYCNQPHPIYLCNKLKALDLEKRVAEIVRLKLCLNCLLPDHIASQCTSGPCRICRAKHNTFLHPKKHPSVEEAKTSTPTDSIKPTHINTTVGNETLPSISNSFTASFQSFHNQQGHVMLSTAMIIITDAAGNEHHCRALLDSGSPINLISHHLASKLGLQANPVNVPITGIGSTNTNAHKRITASIKSRLNNFKTSLSFLVINTISQRLPAVTLDYSYFQIPKNIQLADPSFNVASPVDILIGAELFWDLMHIGQIKPLGLHSHGPILQSTHLGWIVSGHIKVPCQPVARCHFSTDDTLQSNIAKFWEIEDTPSYSHSQPPHMSECEKHFIKNTYINTSGRFVVMLPFKKEPHVLGDSKQLAAKRFHYLEKRLAKNPSIYEQYKDFMSEYSELGHMSPASEIQISSGYFLPHHFVLKDSSLTTKLRVVFDGSAKTTTGNSLNDILHAGPTVQQDLFSIITRFRFYKYVLTADIAKMYRQVLLQPEHKKYHLILWRSHPSNELETYALNTVTYGTTPAPYLATRCLLEVANQTMETFPREANIIKEDFYVDDLLTGVNTIEEGITVYKNLTSLLQRYGFELRKWRTNEPRILNCTSDENDLYILDKESTMKTLGLLWNSRDDVLLYSVIQPEACSKITKHVILSKIAQLFDPLGLLGPVIVNAKIILQRLWQLQLSWDESVPLSIHTMWNNYQNELYLLNQLRITRNIIHNDSSDIELHGLSDASEAAYGACIYLRTTNKHDQLTTLLAQIEASLNSRPLTPISCDPNDLQALTPAHFLVGDSLTTVSEPNYMEANHLNQWQHIQLMHQHFWKRWSTEYLTQLQQRAKWAQNHPNLTANTLVVIRDENQPPLCWQLGRIIETFPGADGVVRVVKVKTAKGLTRLAVAKLCVLPV